MLIWAGLIVTLVAGAISMLATPLAARVAYRRGMMDIPQRHKAHARPTPLLGGCAIFIAVLAPSLLALALARIWAATGVPSWLPASLAMHVPGAAAKTHMALGILAGAMAMHILGLIDDRRSLGPLVKLAAQLVICAITVIVFDVRVLTVEGRTISCLVTIAWLVAITNSFNFLDNMDGLSAGVAAICAAALLAASAALGQVFVSAWLCLMIGALVGFLVFNFPPAKMFMGDAGSLVIGYLLAVLSCLTTYVPPGDPNWLRGALVPLMVMALPLYDTISVMYLRVRERRNPMVGDRSHFSHRLQRRGMSVRSVVLSVYVCAAATALSASLMPHVTGTAGAVLAAGQTVAILALIALLEQDPKA